MGILKKIGESLKKTKESFKRKLDSLFSKGELNEDFFEELNDILISSDLGYKTSIEITEELRTYLRKNKIHGADQAKIEFAKVLENQLSNPEKDFEYPLILTIFGVNGAGKTTTVGKLANYFVNKKKSVCLVAGDTFRAAASAQLNEWAKKNKVKIVKHEEGADASAVVFDGISSAKAKGFDVLIIDTAGRLHTKINLMEELKKINKVIEREGFQFTKKNLIVLDATTGQNSLSQIQNFNQYVKIDGIILTKLDGTSKGGFVISLAKEYNIPIIFVGTGEGLNDIEMFDKKEFINGLLS
ncbi:MAG: signal recognition particle-docking protein FtsY [Clostridia bacterium]